MMTFVFLLCVNILLCIAHNAMAFDGDDKITVLIERIEKLESNDIENKREILSLKANIQNMEVEFKEKESKFLNQINDINAQLVELKYMTSTQETEILAADGDDVDVKESNEGRKTSIGLPLLRMVYAPQQYSLCDSL